MKYCAINETVSAIYVAGTFTSYRDGKSFLKIRGTRQFYSRKCFPINGFPVPRPWWDNLGQRDTSFVAKLLRIEYLHRMIAE